MSSIDLNIIERGLKGQAWSAEKGPITAGDLDKIVEQRTDNSSALNALPTPFARFFVVKEAFRRVLEEVQDPRKCAGDAYDRLVSDTLDVFELLYNQTYHENRWNPSCKIVIREWNQNTDLQRLEGQVPILGKTVANYIQGDLKASGGRLFFVLLEDGGKDFLLATSSPFTGFVTPPDLDKKANGQNNKDSAFSGMRYGNMKTALKRKSGNGRYFRDMLLFGGRDKDFKNYMFHQVDSNPLGAEMKEFRNYIKQVAANDPDIDKDWQPHFRTILSDNSNAVVVNGLPVCKDAGLGTMNFFNDTLVRLPFRLSEEYYRPMTYKGEVRDRNYDFLLPISREALLLMNGNFECSYKVALSSVTVELEYEGVTYEKNYYNDREKENAGRIVELQKENIHFNLAIFPCILSSRDEENNYFKVMAVMNDATENSRKVSIDKLELSFFQNGADGKFHEIGTIDEDNRHANFGVRPAVVRSMQDGRRDVGAGSKFYEVFNCRFDAVELRFALNGGNCEGLLMPKWKRVQRTGDTYTYAVDIGTTNTYISCTKNGKDNEPEQLCMSEPMVAFLHDFKQDPQLSLVSVIEDGIPDKCRKHFTTEFLPALIDGKDYRFPIRTALCVPKEDRSKPRLFDNCNIAFFYGQIAGLANQSVRTDIKWEENNEELLRLFVRELLLIVKADILRRNGLLANTKLVWFRPLSFKGSIRELYAAIWRDEAGNVLGIGEGQIECVSESEAPYYYFSKKDSFSSVKSVSIVDIGGGSSDFVYFANGRLTMANSVHFGCDVLWGNGFNRFGNAKENGIYNYLKDRLHFDNESLESLNRKMCDETDGNFSTREAINFWLANARNCDIVKELKEHYRPLLLYHFASIVYYMAQMYKAGGLSCPRSVLFCGNGSKYIDGLLSSDKRTIGLLVTMIFKDVYGENSQDIQVILPDSRKECTCYGGLYRGSNVEIPQEFIFQGVPGKSYENVEQLKAGFPALKQGLLDSLKTFNRLYEKLLGKLMETGEIKITEVDGLVDTVNSGLEDSLEKNFQTQVIDKLGNSEVYHDSLFFLPVIENILKLTENRI